MNRDEQVKKIEELLTVWEQGIGDEEELQKRVEQMDLMASLLNDVFQLGVTGAPALDEVLKKLREKLGERADELSLPAEIEGLLISSVEDAKGIREEAADLDYLSDRVDDLTDDLVNDALSEAESELTSLAKSLREALKWAQESKTSK